MWDDCMIVEVTCGREGLWGLRNRNMIPIGGAVQLRNMTLEDDSWRTMGGASKLGSAAGATLVGQAAIDYFPSGTVQRTVVRFDDGTVRKDDGLGGSWSTLVSGLTTSGAVPYFVLGGQEAAGNNRKVFHCDRVNAVRVLAADGATMSTIASPPADWATTNQPKVLCVHQGYMWGGGNPNAPHTVYRSLSTNHEDFLTTAFTILIAPDLDEEYITAMLSYKGGLLVWKYPFGVYFIDTSDATPGNWRYTKVGRAGAAGPANVLLVEDDVVWIAPDGSWHAISATQATGSVRAEDFAYRKLGSWGREQMNLAQLASAQAIYYSHKLEVQLACHGQGQTAKNKCLVLDVGKRHEVGERWIWRDRDRNEALFLRKKSEIYIPAMVDNVGQVWELDRANRNAASAAYTSEWFIADTDFGQLAPQFKGRKKNLRFLQVEYDPRGSVSHTVKVYRDGDLKQTLTATLSGGVAALPATLPITLGTDTLKSTVRKRLQGQATRLALQGTTSVLNEDASITRLLIGMDLGE